MIIIKSLIFGIVALSLVSKSDEPSMSEGFFIMYPYKNSSIENLIQEIDGIVYTEMWQPVFGYESDYEVSNFGRIKSKERLVPFYGSFKKCKSIIKKQTPHYKNKYLSVLLKVKQKEKRVFVHRLVAQHFIANPENKTEVNHLNGDKFDCVWLHLEWATPKENSNHALDTKLNNSRNEVVVVKDTVVLEFASQRRCAKYLLVNESWVASCIKTGKEINGHKIYLL